MRDALIVVGTQPADRFPLLRILERRFEFAHPRAHGFGHADARGAMSRASVSSVSTTFQRRIRTGKSNPCPTSVTTITTKTMNKISRGEESLTGNASAAASETTPRIPAVPKMNSTCHGGAGPSRS